MSLDGRERGERFCNELAQQISKVFPHIEWVVTFKGISYSDGIEGVPSVLTIEAMAFGQARSDQIYHKVCINLPGEHFTKHCTRKPYTEEFIRSLIGRVALEAEHLWISESPQRS